MAGLILPTKGSDFVRGKSKQIPRVGESGGLPMPSAPTITKIFGVAGCNAVVQHAILSNTTIETVTFVLRVDVSGATASGQNKFDPIPPVGWDILHCVWTAYPLNESTFSQYFGNDLNAADGGLIIDVKSGFTAYCTAIATLVKL